MKVISWALPVMLTLGASLGVVALAWQPGEGPITFGRGTRPDPLLRARGVLSRVDPGGAALVLDVGGEDVSLRVTPETTVFVEGRMATVDALEVGQSLCAAWEQAPHPVAQWVEPCGR